MFQNSPDNGPSSPFLQHFRERHDKVDDIIPGRGWRLVRGAGRGAVRGWGGGGAQHAHGASIVDPSVRTRTNNIAPRHMPPSPHKHTASHIPSLAEQTRRHRCQHGTVDKGRAEGFLKLPTSVCFLVLPNEHRGKLQSKQNLFVRVSCTLLSELSEFSLIFICLIIYLNPPRQSLVTPPPSPQLSTHPGIF